ncbi:MAG TPA: dihydroneopterin triphosphate diphosphatase [Azoarcus sp.]|nr:dihydroneopterin triphosphate diphosphatase [Azoarcus sp.]
MTAPEKGYKYPVSVLVVIHTPDQQFLLIERIRPAGQWQSITGSLEIGETPLHAAVREVFEETGLKVEPTDLHDWKHSNRFRIRGPWRHLYAPDVTHNIEHVFSLCVQQPIEACLAPGEHCAQLWLAREEAAEKVFSWSNRDAILRLQDVSPHL